MRQQSSSKRSNLRYESIASRTSLEATTRIRLKETLQRGASGSAERNYAFVIYRAAIHGVYLRPECRRSSRVPSRNIQSAGRFSLELSRATKKNSNDERSGEKCPPLRDTEAVDLRFARFHERTNVEDDNGDSDSEMQRWFDERKAC